MKLKIIADENIPYVTEAFSHLGSVETLSGREIKKNHLKNADLLLVRSVTKVNSELINSTAIKMVCSATIGTDHIDLDFLARHGIYFSNAAGSNANSAAEYVMAALLELAVAYNWGLNRLKIGIVGVGNIGKIVNKMARGLGLQVFLNDPPLARETGDTKYRPLEELMQADIISLHVPLTYTGIDKTFHLFDEHRLKTMKEGSVLINCSRGPAVDNQALNKVLISGHLKSAVLDVWENEPDIDQKLLDLVEIGTPHIAGYSLDGKVNGTFQIYQSVCLRFGIKSVWKPELSLPEPGKKTVTPSKIPPGLERGLLSLVREIYPIRRDDQNLREIFKLYPTNLGSKFDQLRKEYPVRREFFNTKVVLPPEGKYLEKKLKILGFQVF